MYFIVVLIVLLSSFQAFSLNVRHFGIQRISRKQSLGLTMQPKSTSLLNNGVYQSFKGSSVNARLIREISVKDVDGKKLKLGDILGPKKSVLVFLRHLG